MRRSRIFLACASLALLAASCTDGDEPASPTTGEDAAEEPLAEVACGTVENGSTELTERYGGATVIETVPQSENVVTVLDAGIEPRDRLLFDLAAGDRISMKVTQTVTVTEADSYEEVPESIGGEPSETTIGGNSGGNGSGNGEELALSFVANVEVSEVTETEFVLTTALSEFSPEGESAAVFTEEDAQSVESIMTRDTISVSGALIESQIAATGELDPDIEAALEGFSTGVASAISPFPDDRLGAGAIWNAEFAATYQGLDTENLVEQTLEAREGTRLGLDFSVDQRIPEQSQAGTTIEETVLTTTGSSVVDLGQPGICRYEASGGGELTTKSGSGESLTQIIEVETTMEPVE